MGRVFEITVLQAEPESFVQGVEAVADRLFPVAHHGVVNMLHPAFDGFGLKALRQIQGQLAECQAAVGIAQYLGEDHAQGRVSGQ